MPTRAAFLSIAAAALSAAACQAQPTQEPTPSPQAAGAAVKPPPPAFQAGLPVVDRDGEGVGAVQSLTEGPDGPLVIVEIDGKLVGLRQATLRLAEGRAVSSQSRAEMLADAGASDLPPR